jgi:hypothetical protein
MCCGLVNSCEVHKVYLVSDLYLRAVTDMQYASEYCNTVSTDAPQIVRIRHLPYTKGLTKHG